MFEQQKPSDHDYKYDQNIIFNIFALRHLKTITLQLKTSSLCLIRLLYSIYLPVL